MAKERNFAVTSSVFSRLHALSAYFVVCPAEGREQVFRSTYWNFKCCDKMIEERNIFLILRYYVIMTLLPRQWIISRERSFLYHFITKFKIPKIGSKFVFAPFCRTHSDLCFSLKFRLCIHSNTTGVTAKTLLEIFSIEAPEHL